MYEKPYYFDPFQNNQPVQPGGQVPPQANGGGGYQPNGAYGQQPQGGPPPYNSQPYQQGQYQAPPNQAYQYGAPVYHYPPYGAPQAPVLDEKAMRKIAKANQERQKIVKHGNVGGALVLFSFLLSMVFTLVLRQTPLGNVYDNSALGENGIYIFYSIFCVGCAALLATVKTRKESERPIIPAGKLSLADSVVYVVVGFACCLFSNIIANVFMNILGIFGLESSTGGESAAVNTLPALFLAFVATAVIPAVVEESAFRGAVLQPLLTYGQKASIIISALLFGLFHGNLRQIPFAFLVGLVLGFVTVKTGSIIPAMIIHFINNANSIMVGYLIDRYGEGTANTIFYIVMAVVVIMAIVLVLFTYLRGRGDLFRLGEEKQGVFEREPYSLTTGQKVRTYFSAPCMIVAWFVFAFQVISSTKLTWFD